MSSLEAVMVPVLLYLNKAENILNDIYWINSWIKFLRLIIINMNFITLHIVGPMFIGEGEFIRNCIQQHMKSNTGW